eukprot:SAG25_NODE_14057_length_259_cov_1.043750_1_plen_42_part_10
MAINILIPSAHFRKLDYSSPAGGGGRQRLAISSDSTPPKAPF